jgi:hypothetical protein
MQQTVARIAEKSFLWREKVCVSLKESHWIVRVKNEAGFGPSFSGSLS